MEYDEGDGAISTDDKEFVEIYNPTNAANGLASGAARVEDKSVDLSSKTADALLTETATLKVLSLVRVSDGYYSGNPYLDWRWTTTVNPGQANVVTGP